MTRQQSTSGRRTFVKALGLTGAAGLAGVTTATPGRSPGPKDRELLIGAEQETDIDSMLSVVSTDMPSGAQVTHRHEGLGYMAVELPESASPRAFDATIRALERRPEVSYAERNITHEALVTPNDPEFGSQYAPQQVNAPTAWDTTFGSSGVTIAVIDTGAQYTHPDLTDRFASNPGRDFVDGDGDPAPTDGASHGTHVSGCASADTDNNEGVAGVSDSTLLNARCLGGRSGSVSDIADGVYWATDEGADIINMSLGGGGYSSTLKRAVEYAYDQNDVLVVCAAGNAGTSPVSYPARYEECVAVSALDPTEDLANFSNYGSDIEVAAPGVNVLSTYPTDDYRELSGTSMACPVAAGVAALGLAVDSSLSASELRQKLKDTAVDVGLSADEQGAGRVDAANIVGSDGGGDDGDTDQCGSTTGGSVSDSLSGYYDQDSYSYPLQFSSPCEVSISLSGPSDADFDLYVTEDGRTPSTSDYDARSISSDSSESITISSVRSGQELGILVDSYSGSGTYTLEVTETGSN